MTFESLLEGDHDAELDEATVEDNCTVDSANPQTATVPEGGTESVGFDVSCDDVPGDLEVSASTTGQDTDSNGYDVQVDPGDGGPVQTVVPKDATASTTFELTCPEIG